MSAKYLFSCKTVSLYFIPCLGVIKKTQRFGSRLYLLLQVTGGLKRNMLGPLVEQGAQKIRYF